MESPYVFQHLDFSHNTFDLSVILTFQLVQNGVAILSSVYHSLAYAPVWPLTFRAWKDIVYLEFGVAGRYDDPGAPNPPPVFPPWYPYPPPFGGVTSLDARLPPE